MNGFKVTQCRFRHSALVYRWSFIISLILAGLFGCKTDEQTEAPAFPPSLDRGALILCEGNFNRGSGDVWFYDTTSHKVYGPLFRNQNGYDLGNVVQSYYQTAGQGFIVVNNSGKIVVVDSKTFKQTATIAGMQSPRYLIPKPEGGSAYVTDLYSGLISIIRTDIYGKDVAVISAGSWTEQGVLIGDTAYVMARRAQFDTRSGGENLLMIDPSTNRIVDSVCLGRGGEEVLYDATRHSLWLSFEHDASGAGKAQLVRFDLRCRCTASVTEFDGLKPARLSLTPDNQYLFFVQNGISYIRANAPGEVKKAIAEPRNWTSLRALSGQNGRYRLIACDAKDYVSDGMGYDILMDQGITTVRDSFPVGIIPGNIY